jgi:hypothetical protein
MDDAVEGICDICEQLKTPEEMGPQRICQQCWADHDQMLRDSDYPEEAGS